MTGGSYDDINSSSYEVGDRVGMVDGIGNVLSDSFHVIREICTGRNLLQAVF